VLIRGIRGGFIGHEFHEFHENDHRDLDAIGLKYIISQSLTAGLLTGASGLRLKIEGGLE